jgi:hypothetical protein
MHGAICGERDPDRAVLCLEGQFVEQSDRLGTPRLILPHPMS